MRCRHSKFAGHPSPGGSCSLSSLRDEVRALLVSWAHSQLLGTLPRVVPVVSAPSEMRCGPSWVTGHPPPVGAGNLSSLRDEVHTVPGQVARWNGDWSCSCRGIPQSAPEGLFLFGKNPPAHWGSSLHTRKGLSFLTQPTSPARLGVVWERITHSPTFNSPRAVPVVSVGFPLHLYSRPCVFRQPGLSQCC